MSVCTMNSDLGREQQQVHESAAGSSGAAADSGREKNGRFAKGNRGGPGNPFGRRSAEMRKVFAAAVSNEVLQNVMGVLIEKAMAGEIGAIKLLLLYALGKPQPMVDPDRVDVDEWKLCEESNVGGASSQAVLIDGMPVKMAIGIAEVMEVSKAEKLKAQLKQDEIDLAEQRAIDAAEDAAIQRGIEESIRAHREAVLRGEVKPATQPKTFGEIFGMAPPSPFGANGGTGAAGQTPSPSLNGKTAASDRHQTVNFAARGQFRPETGCGRIGPSCKGGSRSEREGKLVEFVGRERSRCANVARGECVVVREFVLGCGTAPHPRPLSPKGRGEPKRRLLR